LHRAFRDTGLFSQLSLSEVSSQANLGQPSAQFGQHNHICCLFGYFNNAPYMALKGYKAN
jgi:hypothetical protein